MKNKKWLWIGLAVAVVVALVVVNVVRGKAGKVESVQLARVRQEDITSRVRAPGKIEAKTQVKVSADIMGKIVVLAVKEGDRVRKGQLMLQLDDTQYRAYHEQARATAATARARAREAEQGLRGGRGDLPPAAGAVRAEAAVRRRVGPGHVGDRGGAQRGARPRGRRSRARTRRCPAAADNLRKTRFVAPFDGVVSALNVEAGENVITGTMNNPGTRDPRGLGPVADAREGRRGRDRRGGHEARAEGEDHRGRAARHVLPGHRDRDRQHRQALG